MFWQDWVLTAGSLIFAFALIPSVFSQHKPALSTSLMTGAVLLVFSFVYLTLSLWFASITTLTTGTLWFTLAIQKIFSDKRKNKNS